MTRSDYNARAPNAKYRWTIVPHDVNDDGEFEFANRFHPIVGIELRPPAPDNEHMIPVIAMRNATELFEYCPSCGVDVPHARPVFAVGDYMVYPCLGCEWVWCDGTAPLEGLE